MWLGRLPKLFCWNWCDPLYVSPLILIGSYTTRHKINQIDKSLRSQKRRYLLEDVDAGKFGMPWLPTLNNGCCCTQAALMHNATLQYEQYQTVYFFKKTNISCILYCIYYILYMCVTAAHNFPKLLEAHGLVYIGSATCALPGSAIACVVVEALPKPLRSLHHLLLLSRLYFYIPPAWIDYKFHFYVIWYHICIDMNILQSSL